MKAIKKLTQISFRFKNKMLRMFLLLSIVCSIILVNNCNENLVNQMANLDDDIRPPQFGGDESSSVLTSLFNSAAEGAAGEVGGAAAGWVMGALGLSNSSPDYTEQLDMINEDLQIVISELNVIEQELNEIESELLVINCTDWASTLVYEKGRIDDLMNDYSTYVATAENGGIVDSAIIVDWVDQVLATGSYTSQTPMSSILSEIASQLVSPVGGALTSCIQTIPLPAGDSFGKDTVYYKQVKLYTDYYYSYQVRGLMLLNEAYHYEAWVSAGSPNSDSLSSDSTSYVCQNTNAKVFCNLAAKAVNVLYNNLNTQLTTGGTSFTDNNFVFMYATGSPYLWIKSLEDFTTAAGDNCSEPLTSNHPCGLTADFYNGLSMGNVVYKGYSGWETTGTGNLISLLAGWSSGTAGNYLENSLGFKNMKYKIIHSSNVVEVSLNESGSNQYFNTFFDTEWDYNTLPGGGGPARTQIHFQEGVLNKIRETGGPCSDNVVDDWIDVNYDTRGGLPFDPNNFYDAFSHARYCQDGNNYTTTFSFTEWPGYLAQQDGAQNTNNNAKQFRMPVVGVSHFACTENRLNKNIGGMWTMCGDNFTAWFNYYVPRPETCDDPGAGVTCDLDAGTITRAKNRFDVQNKKKVSF